MMVTRLERVADTRDDRAHDPDRDGDQGRGLDR